MAILPGSRIRSNGNFGTITDNPLTIGATTFNSADLNDLPAVTGDHAIITLDPLRQFGDPEIIMVTAHTAAATVATIQRGMFGTTARQHQQGTLWVHAAEKWDYTSIVTSSTRPSDQYKGQMIYETDTNRYTGFDGANWQILAQLGGWTSYTPTLTQSGAVTKTVTYAKYIQIGKTVIVNIQLAITGSGTASNVVTISLPVTASAAGPTCGTGVIVDLSANANYTGIAVLSSTTVVSLLPASADSPNYLGASVFTAALANGDTYLGHFVYESA